MRLQLFRFFSSLFNHLILKVFSTYFLKIEGPGTPGQQNRKSMNHRIKRFLNTSQAQVRNFLRQGRELVRMGCLDCLVKNIQMSQ